MPKTRLFLHEIRSIGFVDKGACEGADILVIKRAEPVEKRIVRRKNEWCVVTEDGSRTLGCHPTHAAAQRQLAAVEANEKKAATPADQRRGEEESMSTQKVDLSGVELTDDIRKQVEAVAAQFVTDVTAAKDAEIEQLKQDVEAAKTENQDDTDDVMKSVPEDVRKRIEDAEKRAADAETLAKAERDTRLNAEWITKTAGFDNLANVKAEDFGPVMKRMSDVLSKEDTDAVFKALESANEALKQSKVFDPKGGPGRDETDTATEKINKLAAEMVTAKTASNYADAIRQLGRNSEHKSLFSDYRSEQRRRQ